MAHLKKRDVEALLNAYDANPIDALLSSLRVVCEDTDMSWQEAMERVPSSWNIEGLLHGDIAVCDQLLKHLIEHRSLDQI